jgi:CheY-like chemotaxis protein
LRVYSVPGQGAAFTVFFPAGEVAPIEARQSERDQDLRGAGTILVVDDEPAIRQVARTTLERYGYTVLIADNGGDAVELFRARAGEISLVLLDLTMPGMGGEEALRHLRTMHPDIPVILSSGFSDAEALQQFGPYEHSAFLHKPYTVGQLVGAVKTVLERSVVHGREHLQG